MAASRQNDYLNHVNPQRLSQMSDRFKFKDPRVSSQSERTFGRKFKTSLSRLLSHASLSDSAANMTFDMYPLRDRTNQAKATGAPSSMLPGINSTPPLPTFQRATPQQLLQPTPRPPRYPPPPPIPQHVAIPMNTSRRRIVSEADLMPRPPLTASPLTAHPPRSTTSLVPPTTPTARRRRPIHRTIALTTVGTCTGDNKPSLTERLPRTWNAKHDHFICLCDAKGYTPAAMIKALRQFDPGLQGILYAEQIDKRLRQLDQRVEVDYWRTGFGESELSGAATSTTTTTTKRPAESHRIGHQGRSKSATQGLRALLGMTRDGSREGSRKSHEERAVEEEGDNSGVHALTTDERVEMY